MEASSGPHAVDERRARLDAMFGGAGCVAEPAHDGLDKIELCPSLSGQDRPNCIRSTARGAGSLVPLSKRATSPSNARRTFRPTHSSSESNGTRRVAAIRRVYRRSKAASLSGAHPRRGRAQPALCLGPRCLATGDSGVRDREGVEAKSEAGSFSFPSVAPEASLQRADPALRLLRVRPPFDR